MTRGQKGLTLLEILMVLVVFAVMAGATVPWMLGVMESYRLRAAAWEVAGDLRLARQRAVSTQVRHRVCFAGCDNPLPTRGYLLEREKTPQWDVYVRRADFPTGVTLTDNAGGKFTFEAKGDVNGGKATLTSDVGTYEVKVTSSGRVRVCKGTCP